MPKSIPKIGSIESILLEGSFRNLRSQNHHPPRCAFTEVRHLILAAQHFIFKSAAQARFSNSRGSRESSAKCDSEVARRSVGSSFAICQGRHFSTPNVKSSCAHAAA